MPSSSSSWPEMKLPPSTDHLRITDEHNTETDAPVDAVPAIMNFVTADTEAPFTRRDASGTDHAMEGLTWDAAQITIRNGRLENNALTLDKNAFQLVESADIPQELDYYNQQHVIDLYYPHCQKLLQQHLGKDTLVYAFDHNVRSNALRRRDLDNSNGVAVVQNPLGVVHADYTKVSAPKRLQQLAQPPKTNDTHQLFLKKGETLLDPAMVNEVLEGVGTQKRRFAMVNVWRNINREVPVSQRPLACMDAAGTKMDCLRKFSIHYPDRIGENYFCVNDQKQKWFYFPKMIHDEALLLKQWDSYGSLASSSSLSSNDDHNSHESSTFSVHSAFLDPTSLHDAPPRESIEVRCIIIYPLENE
mmetsp:Transcript_59406/g.66483  ORF Transcript_59406/g.66483 Transcript_59406/m.66483 type:complete len:360 (-) Transcript_59406:136-1215(-)